MKSNEEIITDITAQAPQSSADADALEARYVQAADLLRPDIRAIRLHLIVMLAIFVEDAMKDHPGLEKDILLRIAANEAQIAHMWLARGLKRRLGEEIVPARMALIAYTIADGILKAEWSDADASKVLDERIGSVREAFEEFLAEVKKKAEEGTEVSA